MTKNELLNVALLQATVEGVGISLAKFADICIEWATNEAIDKACEWLERALPLRPDDRDELIEQFKQAMGGD